MLDTTLPETRHALEIVTDPARFADQTALREHAWIMLKAQRGQIVRTQTLPRVIHATGQPEPSDGALTVSEIIARTQSLRSERIRRQAERLGHGPQGGDAA